MGRHNISVSLTTGIGAALSVCFLFAVALLLQTRSVHAAWEVAPLDQALTLARVQIGGKVHTVAVTGVDGENVTAVDLSEALGQYPDLPLDLLEGREPEQLSQLVANASDNDRTTLPRSALLPVATFRQNIAAGTNFAEHGEEASIDEPFLFPKIAQPTPFNASLEADPEWLLDYEVELAVIFDRDIQNANDLKFARAGFLLVNDFTERATLLREADLSDPSSGAGFANAKGKPGFLPTGPWMIVPLKDWRGFYGDIALKLSVNGEIRQEDVASTMIWDIDQIIAQTFKTDGKGNWSHRGDAISLYEDYIPKGTTVLTGTPAGVVFNAPGLSYITIQGLRWVFSFSFTGQNLTDYLRHSLYKNLHKKGIFLQPGDRVLTEGKWLGSIDTEITAPK